jgi:2-amino-4-hydroxy-6-hydroxymethyldihydropteridine diphosphokinase
VTETVYIGVGSNIDPETNVPAALGLLMVAVKVTGTSRCFITAPIGRPEQEQYRNCVWRIETDQPVEELKALLNEIETRLGRVRTEDTYAPRQIDLDILLYGNRVLDSDIEARDFLKSGLSDLDAGFAVEEDGQLETDERMTKILKERIQR